MSYGTATMISRLTRVSPESMAAAEAEAAEQARILASISDYRSQHDGKMPRDIVRVLTGLTDEETLGLRAWLSGEAKLPRRRQFD